jgi:hypothetical protein
MTIAERPPQDDNCNSVLVSSKFRIGSLCRESIMNDLTSAPLAMPSAHLPRAEDFLLWPPCLQSYGYRIVDQLFATRKIERGAAVQELRRGPEINVRYVSEGVGRGVDDFMDRNNVAGLLVIRDRHIVLERYGLGLQPQDRWSTMSTVKSMTAMLVGAAVQDGAIHSIDDPVTRYIPELAGCAYEQATIRHLLTMSSGIAWVEDYTDKQSDVNRYSKSLADKVPGGVLALLRGCQRAHPAGTVWHYNTGDTYFARRSPQRRDWNNASRLYVCKDLAPLRHGVRRLLYAGVGRRAGDRRQPRRHEPARHRTVWPIPARRWHHRRPPRPAGGLGAASGRGSLRDPGSAAHCATPRTRADRLRLQLVAATGWCNDGHGAFWSAYSDRSALRVGRGAAGGLSGAKICQRQRA